jgi:hypothetical protein
MVHPKYGILAGAGVLLIGGIVAIALRGRPVAPVTASDVAGAVAPAAVSSDAVLPSPAIPSDVAPVVPPPQAVPPVPVPAPGTYTMADVAAHATSASCWTTVGGNVYDLTEWAARHPGGPGPITRMCGTDGSVAYTRKHGDAKSAARALTLLKIGTLR